MISEKILEVRKRIALACARVNRSPEKIEIVAVSKGRSVDQIKEALEAGINNIGENRVQEALIKYKQLYAIRSTLSAIKWHLVGHLQTNKVKTAVEIFDLIHSVDSIRLAREIDKEAARINKVQGILIEVNPVRSGVSRRDISNGVKTSPEATKFGINPEETIEVIKEVAQYKNLSIKGLMTIAPAVKTPEEARPYFRAIRELKEKISDLRLAICDMRFLSMGMTDDFEVAIEEGADMLRLGRAIFSRE